MKIAVMNYAIGCVDLYGDAPAMETSEDIEAWLQWQGYDLENIYWMSDCSIRIW